MKQIILNYLYIFIIPLIFGFAVRFFCRHAKKAHFVTICLIILAIIVWIIAFAVPSHGSEANALLAVQATCAAVASLLTGVVIKLKKN